MIDIHHLYASEDFRFDPYKCKNCGAIFDSAEIKLPEEEKEEYFRNEFSDVKCRK